MKRTTLEIRPCVWRNMQGHSVLFVNQLDPGDTWGSSIAELKQRFRGTQKEMQEPFTHEKFLFDLTPWLHLPEETRLQLQWAFKPDHPIVRSDPRYPKNLARDHPLQN